VDEVMETLRNCGVEFGLATLNAFHLFTLYNACVSALVIVLNGSPDERIRK
jgi:hypothetical protein